MAALKYSRQRECIREFVQSCQDHPTADTVYAGIKKEFPNISLGTVYRNLSLLVELGEIAKISTGDGPDRFDCNTKPHSHFICTDCHCIQDIELADIDCIKDLAARNFDGTILAHTTTFYGVCKHCAEIKKFKKVVDNFTQVC